MSTTDVIPLKQAEAEVALAVERLALLHLAYAETLFKELGEERGRELTVQAIREYGVKIADKARAGAEARGLPLTPENYDAGGPNWPSSAPATASSGSRWTASSERASMAAAWPGPRRPRARRRWAACTA